MLTDEKIVKIEKSLKNEDMDMFRDNFLDLHPYDQSQFFIEQSDEDRLRIYYYLSPKEVALIMENIESFEQIKLYFIEMDPRFAAVVLSEMSADDAVDILNELDKDIVVSFLTMMEKEAADEIKDLLQYEEKTAGSIMTTEFVAFYKSQTVRQAMDELKTLAPKAETIYYLYVWDHDKRLAGVLSLRELIVSDENLSIGDVMDENVVAVSAGTDQEEIAKMMRDYDFLVLPVIDFRRHLLGIITVDDIMDVMEEEASDDYSKLAAISDVQSPDASPFSAAKKRLPWLIILLFLGLLTASLIGKFEATLEQVSILAIFIPLIAGMAGNTGTQSLAVAIRGLATGEYEKQNKAKLLIRDATTGLITGTVCGIIITLVIFFWKGDLFLGVLVGISIMATLIVATLSGSVVPLIMDRFNIDPAVASGPFITTINDIISILIYFGMATMFMNLFI